MKIALTVEDAFGCELIGVGGRIDSVLTKGDFVRLCHVMMNENPETEFMLVYGDDSGSPKFKRSRVTKVASRISWAWDSITQRAKRPVGIGFYPFNCAYTSRWAAFDFDAHDGQADRARTLAIRALQVVRREQTLSTILTTSGSDGWHLFLFSSELHPIEEWTRYLKSVASGIGADIRSGICELFPNDTGGRARPAGIRGPGTWNPKTQQVGIVAYCSVRPLLAQLEREKGECPFLFLSTTGGRDKGLHDSKSAFTGGSSDWQKKYAILQPGTRHHKLKELVSETHLQACHDMIRENAALQFRASHVPMQATLDDHLEEFERLWKWAEERFLRNLSDRELQHLRNQTCKTSRELLKILINFSRHASNHGFSDFPIAVQNVSRRLGISFQRVSKLRQQLEQAGIISQTRPAATNRSAARYKFC